jgi:hypothetical protein
MVQQRVTAQPTRLRTARRTRGQGISEPRRRAPCVDMLTSGGLSERLVCRAAGLTVSPTGDCRGPRPRPIPMPKCGPGCGLRPPDTR